MDVYHKILLKLFETTGGKQTESVDLVELVKEEGFFPSYDDIYRQLSRSGWISDAGRGDKVKITHWGIKEARKAGKGGGDSERKKKREARRFLESVRELLVMTEEFESELSEDKLEQVRKKLSGVSDAAEELKEMV